MLLAQISPINLIDEQGVYLGCKVRSYDLVSRCTVVYYIFSLTGKMLYSKTHDIDSQIISTWGTDDRVIIESVAQDKGLTILSYPNVRPF